jgi:hypothetical protein
MEMQQYLLFSIVATVHVAVNNKKTENITLGYKNESYVYCCATVILWSFSVGSKSRVHFGPHVKWPMFLLDMNQVCIFSTDLNKSAL